MVSLLIIIVFITACTITSNTVVDTQCGHLEDAAKDDCNFELRKCSLIENEKVRDSCVAELAMIKKDSSVCDLTKSKSAKGFCLKQIAELNNNHDICKTIEDDYWKNICHYTIAVNNNKDVYCSLVENQDLKKDCFREIAFNKLDSFYCDFLSEDERNNCIYEVSIKKLDLETCEGISDALGKGVCEYKVVWLKEDSSQCDKISVRSIKDRCKERFAEEKPGK